MRNKLLIAAVMFFGLSAAAFAQATFSVGSIPVTAVIDTGETDLTGDITFTAGALETTVAGTITINYNAPITSPLATVIPSGSVGATVNEGASSIGDGLLVLTVPAGGSGNIIVTGVRVSMAGTGLTTLSADISSTGNAITAGQTSVKVINSIQAGISAVNASHSGSQAGTIDAVTGEVTADPIITVKEGFLSAWSEAGLGVRVTLAAAPQAGIAITFPAEATDSAGNVWVTGEADGPAPGTGAVTIESDTELSVYYYIPTPTPESSSSLDTLTIGGEANPITIDTTHADLPLASISMTFTVSLAPVLPVYVNNSLDDLAIPRFAASEVGPATLYNITGKTTTLLMPLGQYTAGYDTGVSIANTTLDPEETITPQSGTVTFYFFPQTGASFSYTTDASSPGSGLDSSGNVPAGSTYVVLLSDLLSASGHSGDFTGHVYAITNFTDAHGLFVLSNFTTFSQGGLMLVVGEGGLNN